MPKIINTGAPPTVDANPITNHPATVSSSDTYPSDKPKPHIGSGGA